MITSCAGEKGALGLPAWPDPTLCHLQRLTDGCGIIQHAKFRCPDYANGYCTDDNSRALIAATRYFGWCDDSEAAELMVRYLSFLRFTQNPDGSMRNFVSYGRTFLDEAGSFDCTGQSVWALGEAAACGLDYVAVPAGEMFRLAVPHVSADFPPHSLAYALLGICAYGQRGEFREAARLAARPLADALFGYYRRERADGWEWFLSILTYASARLPQALLCCGLLLEDEVLLTAGLRSLDFLRHETVCEGLFSPVGCHGWYPRGGMRAEFDQQPIDSGAMVEACITAFEVTGKACYWDDALCAMGWFFGNNALGLSLYDEESGGCHDGLHSTGVNENEGAESTIVYLLALLAVHTALRGSQVRQGEVQTRGADGGGLSRKAAGV